MSTYDNLSAILAARTGSSWSVSFVELERLIGVKLPASAFKYPAWWSNNPSNNSMTKIWLKAGWRTEQVDIENQTVVFRRAETAREAAGATGFGERARGYETASARAPEVKMAPTPDHPDRGRDSLEIAGIGERIREARRRAGLSAAALGADLGFGAAAIRMFEEGVGLDAFLRVKKMATALNVSADDLLGLSAEAAETPGAGKKRVRFEDIYGCMKGTLTIPDAVDIKEPADSGREWEEIEAAWKDRWDRLLHSAPNESERT